MWWWLIILIYSRIVLISSGHRMILHGFLATRWLSCLDNLTEYPHNTYIARNYRVPAEDLHRWQYLSIFISFHVILFLTRTVSASQIRVKTELMRNSRSALFKVMHCGIAEKPTTDCISPYNNADLISKVSEKIASENAENCCCVQPHFCLMPAHQRTSANILLNLTQPETTPCLKKTVPTYLLLFVCQI